MAGAEESRSLIKDAAKKLDELNKGQAFRRKQSSELEDQLATLRSRVAIKAKEVAALAEKRLQADALEEDIAEALQDISIIKREVEVLHDQVGMLHGQLYSTGDLLNTILVGARQLLVYIIVVGVAYRLYTVLYISWR